MPNQIIDITYSLATGECTVKYEDIATGGLSYYVMKDMLQEFAAFMVQMNIQYPASAGYFIVTSIYYTPGSERMYTQALIAP